LQEDFSCLSSRRGCRECGCACKHDVRACAQHVRIAKNVFFVNARGKGIKIRLYQIRQVCWVAITPLRTLFSMPAPLSSLCPPLFLLVSLSLRHLNTHRLPVAGGGDKPSSLAFSFLAYSALKLQCHKGCHTSTGSCHYISCLLVSFFLSFFPLEGLRVAIPHRVYFILC